MPNPQINFPNNADYIAHVSPSYLVSNGQLDNASPVANEYGRYQWNLRQILEDESYASLFDDAPRDVKVAVIDQWPGHNNHPQLVNVYETGINLVEGGTNTATTWDNNATVGSNLHGQGAASIIAAEHGQSGMAGVFHRARIIPIRASLDTLVDAIDAAVNAGAEVIHLAGYVTNDIVNNWSKLTGYNFLDLANLDAAEYEARWQRPCFYSNTERDYYLPIFRELWQKLSEIADNGAVFSTGISNWTGQYCTLLVASHPDSLVTGAVNINGEIAPFNSTSYSYRMFAPGGDRRNASLGVAPPQGFVTSGDAANIDDVMTCVGPSSYSFMSGGSAAGPHVAAAAAIVKSYLPDMSPRDIRRMLERNSNAVTPNLIVTQICGGSLSLKKVKAEIDVLLA